MSLGFAGTKPAQPIPWHIKIFSRRTEQPRSAEISFGATDSARFSKSIFRRSLYAIDHDNLYRSVLRNQLEAKLRL